MKILYFDIDGTLINEDTGYCKSALSGGEFENAVRICNFDRVVCVGNLCYIISTLQEMGKEVEPMRMIFEVCDGAFLNLEWMEQRIELMKDPTARCKYMDFQSDFFYVDDLAEYHMRMAGLSTLYEQYAGGRILRPEPSSSGGEILRWLEICSLGG